MGCAPFRKIKKNKDIAVIKNNKNSAVKKQDSFKKNSSENIKIERGVFVQGFSGNPFEKYDIIKQLGEGTYGRVLKVKERDSEMYRAIKIIKKRPNCRRPEEENRIKKEIQILRQLDHPNIIKVFEFYNHKSEFYIISELCEGGELFDKIIKVKKFTEKLAANVMRQILSAMQFCHKNQILHRDLKPENILIDSTENPGSEDEFPIIKVIDFGTAEIFKKDTLLSKQIGTPYYIAPEVLNNLYNEKCDLWSCGVIMYILISGCPPFYGRNDQEIYAAIRSGKFSFRQKIWESVSQEAKNLITKLLDLDFDKRPTAEEAIKDPWFLLHQDPDESGLIQNTSPTENNNNVWVYNDSKCDDNENFNSSFNNNEDIKRESKNRQKLHSAKTMKNLSSNRNLDLNNSQVKANNSNLNSNTKSNKNNFKEMNNSQCSKSELNRAILENSAQDLNKNPNGNNSESNNNNKKLKKILSLNIHKNLKSSERNILNSKKKSKKDSLIAEPGLREALNNLKNFRAERKLQQATLYFMVHTLVAKQDLKFIRDLFNNFDKDKDGRLTKEEIQRGFKSAKFHNFNEKEVQRLMNIIDMDCNGFIEYQEFIAATYDKKKILSEFNLKKAFDMFDRDKSGNISSEELKLVLGGGNGENKFVWEKIISEIDSDGDGEISYEEFKTMMYNLISSA